MNLVQIERTSAIEQLLRDALKHIVDHDSRAYKQIDRVLQSTNTEYVSASVVVDAHRLVGKDAYLHEILAGCDLFVPRYVEPERDPQLNERVERLKAEQANREYEEMTKNVSVTRFHSNKASDSFLPDMKSVQGQIITIFNVFLTIFGSFLFGYKAVEYSTGVKDFLLQVSCGLVCAFIVAVADLYFLFKRLNKLD